jgi:hypothetical protein
VALAVLAAITLRDKGATGETAYAHDTAGDDIPEEIRA